MRSQTQTNVYYNLKIFSFFSTVYNLNKLIPIRINSNEILNSKYDLVYKKMINYIRYAVER